VLHSNSPRQQPARLSPRASAQQGSAGPLEADEAGHKVLDQLLNLAAAFEAEEIRSGRLPSQDDLDSTIAELRRRLKSSTPAEVVSAAQALAKLRSETEYAGSGFYADVLPALLPALQQEAAVPAAAALVAEIANENDSGQFVMDTEGLLPALVAALQFENASGAVAKALATIAQ